MLLRVDNNALNISTKDRVDHNIASFYQQVLSICKAESFYYIILDFSTTRFITLAGAMYLAFIVHGIFNLKKKQGIYIETVIMNCPEQITSALLNFGFFRILTIYGNLKLNPEVIETVDAQIDFWKKNKYNLNKSLKALYWPISSIPLRHGLNFELDVNSFFNDFINFFSSGISLGFIKELNYDNLVFIERTFYKSVNEATKNVWDHSESWGIASIQSTRITKTTFCLFDFGVGFINSYIKRKGDFQRGVENDKKILKWLFEEGNTSNEGSNHGHGLSVLQKFTDITNGILLVNTDRYSIQYSQSKGLRIKEKVFFPGTQIMINF